MSTKFLFGNGSADLRYSLGLSIHDPVFVLETPKNTFVFLDQREIGYFKEKGSRKVKAVLINALVKAARANADKVSFHARLGLAILTKYEVRECLVPSYFPVEIADYLRSKGITLTSIDPFYLEREIKKAKEIRSIEKALDRTKQAFKRVEEILFDAKISNGNLLWRGKPLTSEILTAEVMELFVRHGLEAPVGLIISSGKHSAMPHHPGAGLIRANESIVVDLFPRDRETGYFADMTRTYVKGKPSAKIQKMYDAVLEAKDAVSAEVREGKAVSELHLLCSSILKKRGFDVGSKGFTHATGHGVGLEIHEAPRIGNNREVLKAGQVITIEPGLYYEKIGGVRLEDMILVTKNGRRNLTEYPCILAIE